MVGVNNAVNIPFSVSPKLAKAPYFRLTSIAVEVPTAWAAVPSDNPWAIGLPMWVSRMVLNPSMPPSRPT